MNVLAHGGTVGAAAEILFVLGPVAVFALLSRASRRRREREDAETAERAPGPETTAP